MDVEFLKHLFEDGHYGVITKRGFTLGVRHLQIVYMLASSIVMGMIRGAIAVAILAANDDSAGDTYVKIHNWDKRVQGAVLSSFFFGYAVVLPPAELYLKKVGGKLLMTVILVVNGALFVAMPTIVNKGGWVAVCNAHLLMGITHGCFSAGHQSLLTVWLPPNEKRTFSSFVYGGLQLGIVISFPIMSTLLQNRLGWELVYFGLSMVILAMAVVYGTLTASSPTEHQAVGDNEKAYISDALTCYRKKELQTPWRAIARSPYYWAVACGHTATNIVFVFCLTNVPDLLMTLGFTLKDSIFCAMFPFVAMWASYLITAPIVEWVYGRHFIVHNVGLGCFRKIVNGIGALGVVVCLMTASQFGTESTVRVIILLATALGFVGLQFSGYLESHREMTENFSGTLLMMTSTVSSIAAATVPFLSGLMIHQHDARPDKYRRILLTLASITILLNAVYTVFGSNVRQGWDYVNGRRQNQLKGLPNTNKLREETLSHTKLIDEHQTDTAL